MMAMAMAMMTMPSLNGINRHHHHGQNGPRSTIDDRPTMDDRSKSEEEKLADLANAHQILTEGGMVVSD